MLSLQQAKEIKESIISYLQATFTFRKKKVAQAFEEFINDPNHGMFKGPYVSLKLPFVKATDEEIKSVPLSIKPEWKPYDHQIKSWNRLSTQDQKPQPTLVTTGTGSGKTEAFLYPILDYCYREMHRPGIKVIIMYPMNALATDQAKRLAEAIYEDERLQGKITAGLFIGEGKGHGKSFPRMMGEENIIEDRDTILDTCPDILLTNFKMLDYALMKHNYHRLWQYNMVDSELLQFLVLDELHTYDGAQGTDVANLIRRLKLKLNLPKGHLCPVGTSATIGSGEEAPQLLAEYASKVFGEKINTDAVITENRIPVSSFFKPDDELETFLPRPSKLNELEFMVNENLEDFLDTHLELWQIDKKNIGRKLLKLKIVKDILTVCNQNNGQELYSRIIQKLNFENGEFRKIPEWDEEQQINPKDKILESLLTLISYAKESGAKGLPFMYVQTQLWVRELSGVQYTLEDTPKFTFREQVEMQGKGDDEISALPPWYCRECNSSGWLGVKNDNADKFSKDINEIYEKFFTDNKNVYFILPKDELEPQDLEVSGYHPDDALFKLKVNPFTLEILGKDEEGGIEIQAFRKYEDNRAIHNCPCCNSQNTVAIIGTKIPTLSSVSVSQTMATDLDITEEKNRKILAFTNAVQDAAHQAGFIEARNYRFTFRSSVQKVINQMEHPVTLTDLYDEFVKYWKEHADETGGDKLGGYLYRFYPKDYIGKSSPEDYKEGSGYAVHFLKEFDLRLKWELFSEFGFNSLIGRTLEKTGASSVYFDRGKLDQAWENMQEWISINDNRNAINRENWLRFTDLVLHRSRSRGAIQHTYLDKYREDKFSLWDLNWMRDSRHFLNPKYMPGRSRLPKLLTHGKSMNNLLDTTFAKKTNWFHQYFIKSFEMANDHPDFINEFFAEWTKALVSSSVLDKISNGTQESFAINPNSVWVKKNVKNFQCTQCEQTLYVQEEDELIKKGACLSYRCTGHYEKDEKIQSNYYKAVYNRNRTPRIYAAEHTGLLAREDREELEFDFKTRPNFNSTNALVATSTLEMGIDIGDLNTAYNNSIPPLPSNFLQRIGRAGRKSGDALIINFAKHQSHDLFYFTDPEQMMQGEVNTPGCYLEAKDILRRHFTAFCIDSWTTSNPNDNIIPNFIRDLKLEKRNLTENDFFINRLNKFIEDNQTVLIHRFLSQYPEEIAEITFSEIKEALDNGTFYSRLSGGFVRLKGELHEIEKIRKDLDKEQKESKLSKDDPKYKELDNGKRNLAGIKRSIGNQNVLEYLTNTGILPNYAFPETGVTLNAHVLTNDAEGATSTRPDKDFELVRSASQAIKEFAPENYFYTQGYRFEITGVNIFDWSDKENFHKKRFCSRCDHIEIDGLTSHSNCPKCGDPSWSSSSNVHDFVKMTTVKSFSNERYASLTDDNDDREFINYRLMNHIDLDNQTSEGAWILKEIPFGIEYVRSAEIFRVNYGRKDVIDARRDAINEEEVMTKGFVTCRHCGKSSSMIKRENHKYHYGFCRHREAEYQNRPDDIFKEVFFFRSFQTEVLKIVLPIQDFNTEADTSMFRAGLELGLKKYFKGNPDHIHILPYKEFNRKIDKFDRFLVLYDSIPGGTGYLQQLFNHGEFSKLLHLSYEAIRDCDCQNEGKDGCYKCIYSYGNQYNRKDLSRLRAEKWFESIIHKTDDWEKLEEGLTSLTNSGKIEESELEHRFINLLEIWANKTDGYSFDSFRVNGIMEYKMTYKKNDIKAAYRIRPQISLGQRNGVAYTTRTDFLIVCDSYKIGEEEYKEEVKKIGVYLDGFHYHASKENNRFENDLKIRQSLAENQEYKSWTLTWKDLDNFDNVINGKVDVIDELSSLFNHKYRSNYEKLLKTIQSFGIVNYSISSINVLRLMDQLAHPVISVNENSWYSYTASWTKKLLNPTFNPEDKNKVIAATLTEDDYFNKHRIINFDMIIPVEGLPHFEFANWKAWVNVKRREIINLLETQFTEEFNKDQWELFWNFFNVFQSDIFLTKEESIISQDLESDREKLFNRLAELYEEEFKSFIQKAIEKGIINEENENELNSLTDDNNNIIAEAEFVLPNLKIAIEPFNPKDQMVFEQFDYKIFDVGTLNEIEL